MNQHLATRGQKQSEQAARHTGTMHMACRLSLLRMMHLQTAAYFHIQQTQRHISINCDVYVHLMNLSRVFTLRLALLWSLPTHTARLAPAGFGLMLHCDPGLVVFRCIRAADENRGLMRFKHKEVNDDHVRFQHHRRYLMKCCF